MDKELKITVRPASKDSNTFEAITSDGWFILVRFRYSKELNKWLFYYPRITGTTPAAEFSGSNKDFPTQFLLDACRATFFIRNQTLPDSIIIQNADQTIQTITTEQQA